MSKFIRSILIFSLSFFFAECSFDDKTGIWTDKPRQKAENTALIKLSDDQKKFQKALNPELTINFNSKAKTNKQWIMSGLNYSNHTYHLRFDGQINKFSKYKTEKIQNSAIKENPLIIKENYFITTGEKGSILKFVKRGKLHFIINFYIKKYKKKILIISFSLSKCILYSIYNFLKYYSIN